MRLRVTVLILTVMASGAAAELVPSLIGHRGIERTAQELFRDMPTLEPVMRIAGNCGADETVNGQMAYCTSRNVILYRQDSFYEPGEAYELAHLYGHAVQVRHGVADVALREIRARPDEEAKLRGWVTRQVECIAGFIYGQSGLPAFSLLDNYDAEPLTGSHWGRDPLSKGPKVSIGLAARQEWFAKGNAEGLAACTVGEFGAELLLKALR